MTCPTCSGLGATDAGACLRCYGGGDTTTAPARADLIAARLGMRAEACVQAGDIRSAVLLRRAQVVLLGQSGAPMSRRDCAAKLGLALVLYHNQPADAYFQAVIPHTSATFRARAIAMILMAARAGRTGAHITPEDLLHA